MSSNRSTSSRAQRRRRAKARALALATGPALDPVVPAHQSVETREDTTRLCPRVEEKGVPEREDGSVSSVEVEAEVFDASHTPSAGTACTKVTHPAQTQLSSSSNKSVCSSSSSTCSGGPDTFDSLGLPADLVRGLSGYGFTTPSQVQQQAIPAMLSGRDVFAQAPSGTGKTGAFSVGILSRVDPSVKCCQAVVVSPTLELAMQTQRVLAGLSKHMGVSVYGVLKGGSLREDAHAIRGGLGQVIVGTPGRLLDYMRRGAIPACGVRSVVLDEADQLLGPTFVEEVREVVCGLPDGAQRCLFSATVPAALMEMSGRVLRDPVCLLLSPERVTVGGIQQYHVLLDREADKGDVVCDLFECLSPSKAVVFVRNGKTVEWLCDKLSSCGFGVGVGGGGGGRVCVMGLYSDMGAVERSRALEEFRSGPARVLVCTDAMARGIDVQQVSLVLNLDLPGDREMYIHRVGRCGRWGRQGVAITLIRDKQVCDLQDIEAAYKTRIPCLPSNLWDVVRVVSGGC